MTSWHSYYFEQPDFTIKSDGEPDVPPDVKSEWTRIKGYDTVEHLFDPRTDGNFPKSLTTIRPEKLIELFRKRYNQNPQRDDPELPANGYVVINLLPTESDKDKSSENNTGNHYVIDTSAVVTGSINIPISDDKAYFESEAFKTMWKDYIGPHATHDPFKEDIIIFYCEHGHDRSPRSAYYYRKTWEDTYGVDASNGPVVAWVQGGRQFLEQTIAGLHSISEAAEQWELMFNKPLPPAITGET